MCAGAESVVLVFHGAFHPLRDGCLRLQICPFCGSGSIPLFFDNERPGLHQQPGALVFAGNLSGRDRNHMEKPPPLETAAAVLMFTSRPLRGATNDVLAALPDGTISIHAPLAGRDAASGVDHLLTHISIHAPLAGRDMKWHGRAAAKAYFNPRAPCGARRRNGGCVLQLRNFNPRAPCGARLFSVMFGQNALSISIHAPLAGRDRKMYSSRVHSKISIHAPLAGRDGGGKGTGDRLPRISIHAPLAGRDPPAPRWVPAAAHFNPRAPCGARRTKAGTACYKTIISIHAPLAGRDSATAAEPQQRNNFNPRAPCGARPLPTLPPSLPQRFQSTRPLRGATCSEFRVFADR